MAKSNSIIKNNKKLNNIDTKDIGSKILKKYSSILLNQNYT